MHRGTLLVVRRWKLALTGRLKWAPGKSPESSSWPPLRKDTPLATRGRCPTMLPSSLPCFASPTSESDNVTSSETWPLRDIGTAGWLQLRALAAAQSNRLIVGIVKCIKVVMKTPSFCRILPVAPRLRRISLCRTAPGNTPRAPASANPLHSNKSCCHRHAFALQLPCSSLRMRHQHNQRPANCRWTPAPPAVNYCLEQGPPRLLRAVQVEQGQGASCPRPLPQTTMPRSVLAAVARLWVMQQSAWCQSQPTVLPRTTARCPAC